MSQIQNHAQPRELIEGRPRQVISAGKIDWYAAKFTDSAGYADVFFAAVFGKNPKTGKPNVAIVNPQELKALLKIPDDHILKGFLALIENSVTSPEDLPDGKVGSFEIGEIA